MSLFGERFPYTNIHDMNLDWLVKTMKELGDKMPGIYEDIAKKINAPTGEGDIGDFLINVGHGKTKWENMETRFIPIISQAVDEWLTEHPEATTTVQDGTITRAKLSADVRTLVDGYAVGKTLTGLVNYSQDATVYDGKIFEIGTDSGTVKVFDILADDYIATIQLGGGIRPHGNCITFGNKLYEADPYPLLYVTGYNGFDENNNALPRGTCFVYSIENDFTTALVQSIKIGFITDELWTGDGLEEDIVRYGNFIADPDNNKLYCYTLLKDGNTCKTRLFVFNMPNLSNNDVTLYKADIQEYIDLPLYPYIQGGEYYNNRLYISYGMTRANSGLAVIDLSTKSQIGNAYLGDIMYEPEAVIVLNNDIYVAQYGFFKLSVIPCETNIGNLNNLKTLRNNTIVESINSLVPVNDNFLANLTTNADLNYGSFTKRDGFVSLSYQGKSATHTNDQVLFTLPEGYRPRGFQYVPAFKGNAMLLVRIDESSGQATIWLASNDVLQGSGRIYFSTCYICK